MTTFPFSPLEKLNLKFNLQKCIFEPQPKHDNSQVDTWAIFVCFSKYQSKKKYFSNLYLKSFWFLNTTQLSFLLEELKRHLNLKSLYHTGIWYSPDQKTAFTCNTSLLYWKYHSKATALQLKFCDVTCSCQSYGKLQFSYCISICSFKHCIKLCYFK